MANPDYSEEERKRFIAIRSIAVSNIEKFTSSQRDASVCYLAITIADQFLSKSNQIPVNMELFAFCCVSLTSRLRCLDFSFKNFLNKHGFAEVKDVLVMENRILEGIDFQVQPVTAIHFMHFFFSLLMTKDHQHSSLFYVLRQLIVAMQKDVRYTKFRPSTLAASAILVTSYKLLGTKDADLWHTILKSGCVESEVRECFNELREHDITGGFLYRVKHPREYDIIHSCSLAARQNKGKELLIEDSAAENVCGQEPEFDSSWLDPKEIRDGEEWYSPMEQIVNSLWSICNCLGCDFGSGRLN